MTRFGDQVRAFSRKKTTRADEVLRAVGLEVHRQVTFRSPVDTGAFRDSWRAGIDDPDLSIEERRSAPRVNAAAQDTARRVIARAKFGRRLYITNALPYAGRLEQGYSAQAPAGVVRPAIAAVAAAFPTIVSEVRART